MRRRLEAFGSEFPERMTKDLEKLAGNLEDLATLRLSELVEEREPVRTGHLRGSRSVVEGAKGKRLGWTAKYAAVINQGRKRSKPYSRALRKLATDEKRGRGGRLLGSAGTAAFTRMLGSDQPQAREGMTRGAVRQLREEWADLVAKAQEKMGGG